MGSVPQRRVLAALGILMATFGCGSDDKDEGGASAEQRAVVENYVALVRANYDASIETAKALQVAVDAFVAAPSAELLAEARTAWLAARDPYGQSESYRFYDGPIDDPETGLEGQINAWPLDESFIDYTSDDASSGIINKPEDFPEISEELLISQNENGGEDNIATGYHAIEFLLWGQDLSATGAGTRPFTDFVVGEGGRDHADRRGTYLKVVTDLLVKDLETVRAAWDESETSYANTFRSQSTDLSLREMLRGITRLGSFELSGERMSTAWEMESQEDEHSCFSDNTHKDILNNARAMENVYLGKYGSVSGPGLKSLVEAARPELATEIDGKLAAMFTAIEAIPVPFDQAIKVPASKLKVKAAIDAIVDASESLLEIGDALGLEAWAADEDE